MTMSFTQGPDMIMDREGSAAIKLDGNRVLVVGGFREAFDDESPGRDDEDREGELVATATTEVLDLTTMSFRLGPEMISSRAYCAVAWLGPRHILVLGGVPDSDLDGLGRLDKTEVLDLETMEFTAGPRMYGKRCCAAVSL